MKLKIDGRTIKIIIGLATIHAVGLLLMPLLLQALGFRAFENPFLMKVYGLMSFPLDSILNKLAEKREFGGEVVWPLYALNSLAWAIVGWTGYVFLRKLMDKCQTP